MKTTKLLFLLVLLYYPALYGQIISGYVYDEKEDIPLEGAYVYLDGTTISASTNAEGYFTLKGSAGLTSDLIVSYIGYQNFRLPNPFQYDTAVKILMREDVQKLNEVVINGSRGPFERKQMLKAFKEAFLGDTKAGRQCLILNEEDIVFSYNVDNNTLVVTSAKPLVIRNDYLQYDVRFDLKECNIRYKRQTLSSSSLRSVYFYGTTSFKDISVANSAYQNRKEAYLGSIQHFVKTFYANDWKQQFFSLYRGDHAINPYAFFDVKDTLGIKKVSLKPKGEHHKPLNINVGGQDVDELKRRQEQYEEDVRNTAFYIVYNKKENTKVTFASGVFYLTPGGQYYPIAELRFQGDMAERKVGKMLPLDFKYP